MNDKVSLPNTSVSTTIDADKGEPQALRIYAVKDPSGNSIGNPGETTHISVTLWGNDYPGRVGFIYDGPTQLAPYQADSGGGFDVTVPLYSCTTYTFIVVPHGGAQPSLPWIVTRV
ncbi:hypothetical protein [Pseudomonas purpurea]|uniref:hypothetical protein n=1 Tax=Pseudomonas purpurea TaxID=3136737 RepID=UPI0032647706